MDESEERIIMREKVLIVDDIELNREILAVALGDQYDIVQAADGERTIEILKNDNGDISNASGSHHAECRWVCGS